jgi:chemotaxis methyl-accepting protein methylase
MNSSLVNIGIYLLNMCQFDINKFDSGFLNNILTKRMTETGCLTLDEYANLIENSKNESKILTRSLQINYSEFFRNPLTFAVLENIILPSIQLKIKNTGRKEIRIWSAACASGQEVYSLAILLEELLKKNANGIISYRIFATDQSIHNLENAKRGQYSIESIKNIQIQRFNQWFQKDGDVYSILPELKEKIDFSAFDLLDEESGTPPASIYGDFDLVFCANLLFYYKNEIRKKIIEKTGNCLSTGGFLVTGETERDILLKNNYREVFPQSAIFQK